MKKTRTLIQILGLYPLFILLGCSSKSVNVSEWTDPSGTNAYEEERRIVTDPKLAKRVSIETLNTSQSEEGLLNVQIQLRNLTKKTQSMEYKFEWIDHNDMLFETPSSVWKIEHIYGGDSAIVSSVAPHETIKDFVFKMKRR